MHTMSMCLHMLAQIFVLNVSLEMNRCFEQIYMYISNKIKYT